MSDKIKQLVQEIVKEAQDWKAGPRGGKPKVGPKAAPMAGPQNKTLKYETVSGEGTNQVSAAPAIKKMQTAIQEFASTSVKYRTGKPEIDPKTKKVTRKIDPNDSRRNFNDFLAEQFSAGADIHGEEFSPEADHTTKESKAPTDIIQLNNIIDGLQRIGAGSKEALADGRWDFRTNNAVKNIYAIATALVAANEALGGAAPNDPRVFKRADLNKMKQYMPKAKDPAKEVPQAKLAQLADGLTPLIEKLTEFYNYYSKSIMIHPAYRDYIKGDKPLLVVKPGVDPAALDENEAERMRNAKAVSLPYLRTADKDNKIANVDGLTLAYLQNRQGLQKMMQDLLGFQAGELNDAAMRRTVQNLINNINKILETNRTAAAPVEEPLVTSPAEAKITPVLKSNVKNLA